jgi:hypothetical protein
MPHYPCRNIYTRDPSIFSLNLHTDGIAIPALSLRAQPVGAEASLHVTRSALRHPATAFAILEHLLYSPPADVVPGFQNIDALVSELGPLFLRLEDAETRWSSAAVEGGETRIAARRRVRLREDLGQ